MNAQQTYADAVRMVVSVLADGSRNDRYLRKADDGHYFTTPDHTLTSNDGQYTPPGVKIPVSYDGTEEDDQDTAAQLLQDLDDAIEAEAERVAAEKRRTIRIVTAAGTNASEIADAHCHGDWEGNVRWYGSVDRVDSDGCGRVFIECSEPVDADAIAEQLNDDPDVEGYEVQ